MTIIQTIKGQTFQNLVPNGSFENYTQCPSTGGQLYLASPWTASLSNSTDYFNACSSTQNVPHTAGINSFYPFYCDAKDGNAFIGLFLFLKPTYREYAQVQLQSSLEAGKCYYVEFFAVSAQYGKYNANNASASLSPTTNVVTTGSILSLPTHITRYNNDVIKDTINWQQVAGLYTAVGDETHITIGNFRPNSQTDTVNMYPVGTNPYYTYPAAYIYVDAVSVFSINPNGLLPWSYRDTTILIGDSVYIGNYMGGNFNPKWYTIGGNFIAQNAGIYVKPTTTSDYVVQYTVCGTPRSDTVRVNVSTGVSLKTNQLVGTNFKIYPNPIEDYLDVEIAPFNNQFQLPHIKITDVLGRAVKDFVINSPKEKYNLADLESGYYNAVIEIDGYMVASTKMIKR